jgi:hypothetical protein
VLQSECLEQAATARLKTQQDGGSYCDPANCSLVAPAIKISKPAQLKICGRARVIATGPSFLLCSWPTEMHLRGDGVLERRVLLTVSADSRTQHRAVRLFRLHVCPAGSASPVCLLWLSHWRDSNNCKVECQPRQPTAPTPCSPP